MIHLANPELLYLLLLIPALGAIYALGRSLRTRRLKRFGDMKVIARLMPDVSRYMPTVKICIELTALFFIIIAISRPFVYTSDPDSETSSSETTSGIEVMICMDVSNSMLASSTDDPKGVSRLQRAKFILEK